jgi:hypothetical protein
MFVFSMIGPGADRAPIQSHFVGRERKDRIRVCQRQFRRWALAAARGGFTSSPEKSETIELSKSRVISHSSPFARRNLQLECRS